MKDIKIVLRYCNKTLTYKLIKQKERVDANDPCVLWVFDPSKIHLAKKIVRNMNLAAETSLVM